MTRTPPKTPKNDYEVGYRRPPKATRFKPGQYGNPRGRAKRSKNGRTLLERVLNETVIVNEGRIPKRITKRELFFKTLVARSLKNDRYATLLIKFMEQNDIMIPDRSINNVTVTFVDAEPKEDPPSE